MSSVITFAFENWKAQAAATGKAVELNEFVFANVPNLDETKPIDRNESLPEKKYIVDRKAVNKTGLVSVNAVAYSVTLGTDVGDYDFNWIGLLNKESGTVAMITHVPTQKKIKTKDGQQGNVLTRSFLLEFNGAAEETQIQTSAETWQIDFTARLFGIDEVQRLINLDTYGVAAFFNEGFLVTKENEKYTVNKGLAYISGLRGELKRNQSFNALNSTKIYADFSYQGNLVSQWEAKVKLTVAENLTDYTDNAGFNHFVAAIAEIDSEGNIQDLRTRKPADGEIEEIKNKLETKIDNEQLSQELGSDEKKVMSQAAVTAAIGESFVNIPDATKEIKGKTKLTSEASTDEDKALTPLALYKERDERKNYEKKLEDADIHRILALTQKTQLGQKSMMQKIKAMVSIKGMYVRSFNNELLVGVNMGDKHYQSAIEYRFVFDKDGLFLLRGIRSGLVSSSSEFRLAPKPDFIDPSVLSNSPPNSYTTKEGAKITGKITTNRFIFKSYQDPRGGCWLVTLTNGYAKYEKVISTWRSEEASGVEIDVFGKLPLDEYDYTLKFVGKDPYNAPSDGIARGWLYYNPDDVTRMFILTCGLYPLEHNSAKWLSPTNTIVDFAISAKPNNFDGASTWTPTHGDTSGVAINTNSKIYIDGIMIDNSYQKIPDVPMTEITSFRIEQQFDAKNANDPRIMWHQWVMHSIDSQGELSITSTLDFKRDTWISNAYLAMVAGKTDSFTRLEYDDGQLYSPLKADGSTEFYQYGAQAVCLAGYYDREKGLSHGIVCEVNPHEASNWLKPYQPTMTLRQENRTDGVTKTYWVNLNNTVIPAGVTIKSQSRFYCVSGVRSPNNELRLV